jgi:hypothetical protein
MHSFKEDFSILFQAGPNYIREIEWGDLAGDFWALSKGFDSNPLFKGLPNGCEVGHWGYLLKGRMRVIYADHEEVIPAGAAYYMEPGHNVVMEEDSEGVEFSHKGENRRMLEAATRSMATS